MGKLAIIIIIYDLFTLASLIPKAITSKSNLQDAILTVSCLCLQDKCDVFVPTHFFGWWIKTLIFRDWWLCTVISIMFEILEYSLEHQLPNFSECWWDHVGSLSLNLSLNCQQRDIQAMHTKAKALRCLSVYRLSINVIPVSLFFLLIAASLIFSQWVMDALICNGLGIFLGMVTLKYLSMKPYNWRGLYNIPTYRGKLKRVIAQFGPHSWIEFDW